MIIYKFSVKYWSVWKYICLYIGCYYWPNYGSGSFWLFINETPRLVPMSKRSVRRPIVGSGMKETTLSCESDELHLEAIIDHANSTKPFHGFENFHQWHAEFHHNVCDAESTAPVDAHLTMNQHFPAIFSGVFDDGLRFGKMLQNVVVVIVFSVEGMIHPDIGFVNIDIWIVDGPARTVDDMGDAKTFQSLDVLGFAVAPKKEVLSEHGGAVPNHPYRILGQELLYPTGEHWIFCNRHHLLKVCHVESGYSVSTG